MSGNSDQRDDAIARVAAEALRSGTATSDSVCPDAEIVAAFADRTLTKKEAANWENHFAACARCRKMLALLAVTSEAAGQTSSASNAVAEVASIRQRPAARPKSSALRWLVPAFSAAAAVALWVALRPAQPLTETVAQVQRTAQNSAPTASAPVPGALPYVAPEGHAGATSSNSPSRGPNALTAPAETSSQIARAEVPGPPAAPQPAAKQLEARRDLDELKDLKKEADASAAAATVPATPPPSALASSRAGGAAAAESNEESRGREAFSAAPQSAPKLPADTPGGAAPDKGAAPNPPSFVAGNLLRSQVSGLAGSPGGIAGQPVIFTSPDRSSSWRIGGAGRIERSSDEGRTWGTEASGVTTDLLAGVAASNQVAWVVGRAGVILRTADGLTWQRINPPAGSTTDWIRVEATDAQHASITSVDQRRFATADGGNTWNAQ